MLRTVELCSMMLLLTFNQVQSFPRRRNKLSSLQSEWSGYNLKDVAGPGTYVFGYDVEDVETNNVQFRDEERHANGTVTGSYGYLQPDGNVLIVHYSADSKGYRAVIEDSRRGSLKTSSPEMVAAMDSIKVFKTQKKFEQRERPLDFIQKTSISSTSSDVETKSTASQKGSISSTVAPSWPVTPKKIQGIHAYYYFPSRKGVAF